ncbi:hypothetical protein AAG747_12740 [Rapidithrix thailandica]|uniref:Uncharacterized protein n=1 Tax=Rapidithrix thailandica TaxID=413964 RepID=A0AAW9SAL2_9BACT
MKNLNFTYTKYLVIPFLAVLFFSCEEKDFGLVLNVDNEYTFTISDDGVYEESKYITREEIMEQINREDVSNIDDVNIESIAIKIVPKEGNLASKVNIGGSLVDMNNQSTALYASREVAFDDYKDFTPLTSLERAGILLLTEKVKGYINATDDASLSITTFGTSVPEGERIELDVIVRVRLTVKYTESLNVPNFMGNE